MKWYFMIFMLNFPREVERMGKVLGLLGFVFHLCPVCLRIYFGS